MTVQPVVLCGGAGSRLWPLSRQRYPKQLLALIDHRSLLQNTASRLDGTGANAPIVVCNEEHRFLVAEQLREISCAAKEIILEPKGRNTAPAIALAAFRCRDQGDAVLLVLPSDHVIKDVATFQRAAAIAEDMAKDGDLVTFGVVPANPETGYGYIKPGETKGGGARVAAFVEKPDAPTAEQYVAEGYFWNSGMFAFRVDVYLEELRNQRPDIYDACERAVSDVSADMDFLRVDVESFSACPSESVDYAVMEGTARAAVVPLDAGWSDIGSWSALFDALPHDQQGNATSGDVVVNDVSDSYIRADHRLVSVIGLDNVIVVETADAVLVGDKAKMQLVKDVVGHLNECERDEPINHRRVYRPWGYYEGIDAGDRYQVKQIEVNPGASLSLQKHHHRAEHWIVVSGTGRVTRGEEVFDLTENQSTYIPIGATHRLENFGEIPLRIIEIQSGSYLGEDDIVRLEDNYGRS